MKTLNINLTSDQAKLVDKTSKQFGFANRSEFMRAVLRYVFQYSPAIIGNLDSAVFEEPPVKDITRITTELAKSGKYNPKFITSIEKGLKKSRYFNK